MVLLYVIAGAIVAFMAISIIKVSYPMWRFMSRAKYAKELYKDFYKILTEKNIAKEEPSKPIIIKGVEIKTEEIGEVIFKSGVYSIILDNIKTRKDIMQELKDIIKDALSYTEPIEYLIFMDGDLKNIKTELIEMYSNIGVLLWHNS